MAQARHGEDLAIAEKERSTGGALRKESKACLGPIKAVLAAEKKIEEPYLLLNQAAGTESFAKVLEEDGITVPQARIAALRENKILWEGVVDEAGIPELAEDDFSAKSSLSFLRSYLLWGFRLKEKVFCCSCWICFCSLGFSRDLRGANAKDEFLRETNQVEEFLTDAWGSSRVLKEGTVQVRVPKVVPAPQTVSILGVGDGGGGIDETAEEASAQKKRVALQRQATITVEVAEDYARRFESGVNELSSKDDAGEELAQSGMNIMCRMCFLGGSGVNAVLSSTKASSIYSGGADGMVYEIDPHSGNLMRKFKASTKAVSSLSVSPDGKILATAYAQLKVLAALITRNYRSLLVILEVCVVLLLRRMGNMSSRLQLVKDLLQYGKQMVLRSSQLVVSLPWSTLPFLWIVGVKQMKRGYTF